MNRKLQDKIDSDIEFKNIIQNLIDSEVVQDMKLYKQHCNVNCYEHCLETSYYSYILAKKWKCDDVSMARGAMLHDLFLYDWRKDGNKYGLHPFVHGKVAYANAREVFDLNDKEKDIIVKHMWPLTIVFPKYKESYIMTLIDKYCTIRETLEYIFRKRKNDAELLEQETALQ